MLTAHTVLASLRGIPTYYLSAIEGEPNDMEAAEREGDSRALNRPKHTVATRRAKLIGDRKASRDELLRRLNLRRKIPAFHPEARQHILELESKRACFVIVITENCDEDLRRIRNPRRFQSKLYPVVQNCVMEIVINGLTFEDISLATKTCIESICKSKIKKDIISISAGNYGGKLGQYHFHLRKIMK